MAKIIPSEDPFHHRLRRLCALAQAHRPEKPTFHLEKGMTGEIKKIKGGFLAGRSGHSSPAGGGAELGIRLSAI